MVHSPTDDLFNTQQWEHWAMIFILVLGLVVGYGQAAAEDRRRAQHRQGDPRGQEQARRSRRLPPSSRRRSGSPQPLTPREVAQRRIAPPNVTEMAPKRQRRRNSGR